MSMVQENKPLSLPFKLKVAYALGQFGWSLILGLINIWLVWFYNPPQGETGALSVLFIPQNRFWGFLTVIGIITMIGRLIDAVTDPWIATLSDQSNNPKGRRISFMAKGTIPFGIFTFLAFCTPLRSISMINVIWLGATLILSFVFYTIYVTPYFALVSEFGHTDKEKLDLSTYISATWFLGYAVASLAAYIWPVFENMGFDKVNAIRMTIGILVGVGILFMFVPVFFIDERKYSRSTPSKESVISSMKATFENRDFRVFVLSDLVYWFAVTMFSTGTVYYVTVLVGLPETWAATTSILTGVVSFLCYPIVNITAKKIGKKSLLSFAFVVYSLVFVYTGFLGKFSWEAETQVYLFALLAGLPMAILGILPNAIIADVAEYDAKKTGTNREAMFFGARTFMSKMGQMLAMLVFNGVIMLGKSAENPVGIRMTAFIAAITCLVGMIVFLMYNEKKILGKSKN
jgi:GPH family glycoside/pentoside/hexuronide:cation symporter